MDILRVVFHCSSSSDIRVSTELKYFIFFQDTCERISFFSYVSLHFVVYLNIGELGIISITSKWIIFIFIFDKLLDSICSISDDMRWNAIDREDDLSEKYKYSKFIPRDLLLYDH